jgi:hypothetical protein
VLTGLAAVVEAVELAVAGDGETMEGLVVVAEAVVVGLADEAVGDDGRVWAAGCELSLGTAPAKGLRAMRARTTFAGSFDGVVCVDAVVVWLGDVGGGAGGVVAPPADAPLSRSSGTATTHAMSSATTIQSLPSSRSRRSALIPGLRT